MAGARQDCDVARLGPGVEALPDLVEEPLGLVVRIEEVVDLDLVPLVGVGEERLAEPLLVLVDDGVGDIEDVPGGTEVLLQPDDPDVVELLRELEDVLDPRAAPGIEHLVIVADDGEIGIVVGDLLQPSELEAVGVLILVDEDVLPLAGEHLGVDDAVVEGLRDDGDQVREVEDAVLGLGLLVLRVDVVDGRVGVVDDLALLGRIAADVLNEVDRRVDQVLVDVLSVDGLAETTHETLLVIGVHDDVVLLHAEEVEVLPQHACADRVEGAHLHAGEIIDAQLLLKPCLEFPCGLVGEGDCEDLLGRRGSGCDDVCDPAGEGGGFAGACAGEDYDRRPSMLDCLSLLRGKAFDDLVKPFVLDSRILVIVLGPAEWIVVSCHFVFSFIMYFSAVCPMSGHERRRAESP